jgi:hypothetical protein
MKYLLITTTGNRNTGDELIRIGIQNLIKEIDPSPKFVLLDKEYWPEKEIKFDKCILCGMPLFWDNEESYSQKAGWWGAIFDGFPTARKKDFLILGAGHVVSDCVKDPIRFGCAIQEAIDKSFAVTTRNFIIDHPKLINSICPAAFAITTRQEPKIRLCNFMKHGAHDKFFNPKEAEIWESKVKELSDFCLQNDFYFIEHEHPGVGSRHENPEELGWPKDRILRFETAKEYLPIYAQSSCYFGNRLHGAMLVAALGRPAIGIGYESRLEMIELVGAKAYYPSEIELNHLINLVQYLTEIIVLRDKLKAKLEQKTTLNTDLNSINRTHSALNKVEDRVIGSQPEIIDIERKKNIELLKQFITA